jgi:hypothetical protein
MTVTDIGEQEVPPGYLPLRVPVEVHLTQRVAVDVTLRTPDGVPLGDAVRLSVHSNAYGKLLFAITLAGGAVLALLVGRRLYHRFRGQPDRADLDRPREPRPSDHTGEPRHRHTRSPRPDDHPRPPRPDDHPRPPRPDDHPRQPRPRHTQRRNR